MSYILEALRRSQAERERGQVPGLGTQALPVAAPEPTPRRWPAWALAVGLGLGLVALLLLWLLVPRPAEAPKPVETATTTASGPAPAALAALRPALPPVTQPTGRATAAPTLSAGPSAVTSASAPPPALVVVSAPVSPQPAASASTAAPSAPGPAVVPLAQLSPEQRRDWPPFSLGGTVWSESPGSRFIIANGQVVHEGEAVAPGLVLDRIAPRTLRLRWRGLLVEMPH